MACAKCKSRTPGWLPVCESCYTSKANLPTQVKQFPWVSADPPDAAVLRVEDMQLRHSILEGGWSGKMADFLIHKGTAGKTEFSVDEPKIDALAQKTGLVVGKWLLYASREQVDAAWKQIAAATFKGDLGMGAKASTARTNPDKEHVICVYTKNYLDMNDVNRVRNKLKELGFNKRLYYKPDIYTLLGIYGRTFPGLRSSRYSA